MTSPRLFDIVDELPPGSLIRVNNTVYVKREGGYLNDVDDHSPVPLPVLKMTDYQVLSTPSHKGYIFDEERHAMVFVPDTDSVTSDFLIPERELAKHWLHSVQVLTLLTNRPGAIYYGNYAVTVNMFLNMFQVINPTSNHGHPAPGLIYFEDQASAEAASQWMNTHHPLKGKADVDQS